MGQEFAAKVLATYRKILASSQQGQAGASSAAQGSSSQPQAQPQPFAGGVNAQQRPPGAPQGQPPVGVSPNLPFAADPAVRQRQV